MPLKVLVVEDEALVALMVEDAVTDAGHEIVAIASNLQDALRLAAGAAFDVALLDLNLNGQKGHALPVMLQSRGKPFAFVTGYGEPGVLAAFAAAPVVRKPFRSADIARVLEQLAGRLLARETAR